MKYTHNYVYLFCYVYHGFFSFLFENPIGRRRRGDDNQEQNSNCIENIQRKGKVFN